MLLAATSEAVMCLSFSFMRLTLSSQAAPALHSPPVQTTASWCNGLCGCIGAYSLATASEKCFCKS